MNKNHLLIVGLPLALLAHSGAAPVTWTNLGTSTVNESSIDLTGDLVHAGRWGGAAQTVTVGSESIVFDDMPAVNTTTPNPGSANAIASAGGEHQGTDVFNPPGAIDPAFESVMEGFAWDGPNPKRLVLNNLVVGAYYQVQIFVSDDRGGVSERTQRWSDNVASGAGNETNTFTHGSSSFVIGRFLADSTTQTIYGHGISQSQNAVNAYVLRELPVPDSDGDGLPDDWELLYTTPPSSTALNPGVDLEPDGLSNLAEYQAHCNPLVADTDGDQLTDGAEVSGSGNLYAPGTPTNPLVADSDGDRVSDYDEVHGTLNTSFSLAATDPNYTDTDADGADDYKELVYHSDPNDFNNLPTPLLVPLISNTLQNGSFEKMNGGMQITAKITKWDEVGNDIDNWTEWGPLVGGPSTAPNDSGAEAFAGTDGSYVGYFQSGNAAYNLTTNIAAAGSVYACTWKQKNQGGSTISVQLVYKDANNNIVAIPGSLATTNTAGGVGDLIYQIPAGSPAIGFPIGIGMGSTGWWIDVDEVALNIAATGDDDGDGLSNLWEVANGLNPNSAVGDDGASGDPDGDGYTNLDEQAGGSNPQLTASIPGDVDGDGLGDTWELTYFGSLSNPNGAPGLDPDGDRDTNLVEFGHDTDPNSKFSFYSSTNDLVPDSWKAFYGIGLGTVSSTEDSDGDGLFDEQEFTLNTNPILSDTDGDGLSDSYEVNTSSTNPLVNDSDNDGLLDGAEVNTHLTGPNDADSDDDGYLDGAEITAGSNPLDASSTPFNLDGGVILIDPTHNNGSFETGSGKLPNWGLVDFWDEWTGVSTASGDSGTDTGASATQGTRVAFLQGNNAAYNMTTHVVAAGDIYTFQWDHTLRNSSHTVSLVWNNGGTVTSIAASEVTSPTVGNGKGTSYQVFAGDPAIGSTIGLGIKNNNSNYPEVDNFILVVTRASGAGDSDFDGLADSWETTYFGGLGERAAGDFDNDGTSNLTEFRLGLIPNSGTSRFGATYSSTGLIQWPSVTGVTFKIERSTTLVGTWTTLESAFPGTAGTASYTDPSPPVGKAFYKVELNP